MEVVGRDQAGENLLQIARHMIVIASGKILSPSRSFKKLVPRAIDGPEIAPSRCEINPRATRGSNTTGQRQVGIFRAQSVDRVLETVLTRPYYRNSSNCASWFGAQRRLTFGSAPIGEVAHFSSRGPRGDAQALRQAILKAAFEGRLVPQDSTDEPASALLARLRNGHPGNEGRRRIARCQPIFLIRHCRA
jgi:hypothetical protein